MRKMCRSEKKKDIKGVDKDLNFFFFNKNVGFQSFKLLLLTSSGTFGRFPNLTEPQPSHLQNGNNAQQHFVKFK